VDKNGFRSEWGLNVGIGLFFVFDLLQDEIGNVRQKEF